MSATAPFVPVEPVDPPRRSFLLPTWRQAWFQLHWLIGITAGTVLIVIGLTGATLMFSTEILDAMNPGIRHVAPRPMPMLSPEAIVQAVKVARPTDRVAQITVLAEPGSAARVLLAPPPGQRRGETVWVDPYTGQVQRETHGTAFFDWVEQLHRFLLLPRDDGKLVAGTLSICLLFMSLSGLYLRWPKRALDWRTWFTFDVRLTGRSFLWGLHSVVGTFALAMYLVSTSTGIYWAFESVRDTVDGWLQVDRQGRHVAAAGPTAPGAAMGKRGGGKGKAAPTAEDATPIDLAAAWTAFQHQAGTWTLANLRVPQRAAQPLEVNWLPADPHHDRARSRMLVSLTGEVTQDDRYDQTPAGARFQSVIYPLHMGTYFGLPGRIAMALAALMLPVFAVTGWMLYLKRRHAAREARIERSTLLGTMPVVAPSSGQEAWLVAYASQTGHAERLAWRTAASLTQAGCAVRVESIAALDPGALAGHRRVLFVASTFGEGEPPDIARRFARRLAGIDDASRPLKDLRFGVLALGDRHYGNFCGFGRSLQAALEARGATALFPLIDVDNGQAEDSPARIDTIARWSRAVGQAAGAALTIASAEEGTPADKAPWTLSRRQLLNPGSQGGPLFELTFTSPRGAQWSPGALVDIVPRHPQSTVAAWLRDAGLDGSQTVHHGGHSVTLSRLLARCELPAASGITSAQSCADALVGLMARSYSVASITDDGAIELLVRQERHAGGLGIASGWLTQHASIGAVVDLRIVPNPSFEPATHDAPCIYIGNGSGLAGLRSHLRARVRNGQRANWLLFGERESAHDRPCHDEIAHWRAKGLLERVDLVFSRDPPGRTYVQDRLREAADDVRAWVDRGACLFVCGSLHGMSAGVDAALRDILGADPLDDLIAAGRYRRDVY